MPTRVQPPLVLKSAVSPSWAPCATQAPTVVPAVFLPKMTLTRCAPRTAIAAARFCASLESVQVNFMHKRFGIKGDDEHNSHYF